MVEFDRAERRLRQGRGIGRCANVGLDLEQYDADYADPAVAERVQRDVADGVELGVQGTPTFFLNGARFEPRSFDDFDAALAEALAQQR